MLLTHLLRWWIAVAEIIIYAKSVDNLYIVAKNFLHFNIYFSKVLNNQS
jgi:hypothetical protein